MIVETEILKTGDYLTDGKRLVQVLHVIADTVTVEEGSIDAPGIGTVALAEIAAGTWRLLEPVEEDATDAWLSDKFPSIDIKFSRELRLRTCGCSRCLSQLAVLVDDGA